MWVLSDVEQPHCATINVEARDAVHSSVQCLVLHQNKRALSCGALHVSELLCMLLYSSSSRSAKRVCCSRGHSSLRRTQCLAAFPLQRSRDARDEQKPAQCEVKSTASWVDSQLRTPPMHANVDHNIQRPTSWRQIEHHRDHTALQHAGIRERAIRTHLSLDYSSFLTTCGHRLVRVLDQVLKFPQEDVVSRTRDGLTFYPLMI